MFSAPGPVKDINSVNKYRRESAELLREDFIESLNPDVIHIGSLFEGYLDDAIISLGKLDSSTPVSITLHDLIPLVNPEQFFSDNPGFSSFYNSKLKLIGQAELILTNSKSTKKEALENSY